MPAKIEFQQSASLNQPQSDICFGSGSNSVSFRFTKSLRLLCAADFKPVFDDAPLRNKKHYPAWILWFCRAREWIAYRIANLASN